MKRWLILGLVLFDASLAVAAGVCGYVPNDCDTNLAWCSKIPPIMLSVATGTKTLNACTTVTLNSTDIGAASSAQQLYSGGGIVYVVQTGTGTATGTATTTETNLGAILAISNTSSGTATNTYTLAMPNATKTFTGTVTVTQTDLCSSGATAGGIPCLDTNGQVSTAVTTNLAATTDTRFGIWTGTAVLTNYTTTTDTRLNNARTPTGNLYVGVGLGIKTDTSTATVTSAPLSSAYTVVVTATASSTNILYGTGGIVFNSTDTFTATNTSTGTVAIIQTGTGTATGTTTFSGTQSITLSDTATSSTVATVTVTRTGTLSLTGTQTQTITGTATITLSGTETATGTGTLTATSTGTATASITSTATQTWPALCVCAGTGPFGPVYAVNGEWGCGTDYHMYFCSGCSWVGPGDACPGGTVASTMTSTTTVTAAGTATQTFTGTAVGTVTGSATWTSTSTGTTTSIAVSANPTISYTNTATAQTIAVGSNLAITTGTSTITATSGALTGTVNITAPGLATTDTLSNYMSTKSTTSFLSSTVTHLSGDIPTSVNISVGSGLGIQTDTSTATVTSAPLSSAYTVVATNTATSTVTKTSLAVYKETLAGGLVTSAVAASYSDVGADASGAANAAVSGTAGYIPYFSAAHVLSNFAEAATTATPSVIPVSDLSGTLNAWVSHPLYNFYTSIGPSSTKSTTGENVTLTSISFTPTVAGVIYVHAESSMVSFTIGACILTVILDPSGANTTIGVSSLATSNGGGDGYLHNSVSGVATVTAAAHILTAYMGSDTSPLACNSNANQTNIVLELHGS